ncbi:nucleoside/nucleotide kinase family protein [Phycicoccus sp. CMS6Z-2]|nr:nucleoside/nucleotide kinase family protein [Phycicoccus flavus]
MPRADTARLVERARALAGRGGRRLLGLTGSPGAGKSTLAEALVAALGPQAVLLPMDGFHLAQSVLEDLGRTATKGAADTFDAAGFVHLLRRVRAADEDVVYAPTFRRDLEEPVAGAVAVPREVPLVVVEGNYLLTDAHGFDPVAALLDESWFVDPGPALRREWLVARHMTFGRDHAAAVERSDGSDQVNAELVEQSRSRADVVVEGA